MNEQTRKVIIIYSCIILLLIIVIITLGGICASIKKDLAIITNDKTELIESNESSFKLIDSLEQKLRDRDARIERDKRTISTLQTNIRKSEINNRESEENRRRLDEANRRLEEYERRERDKKSERNRIITEIESGIKKLRKDIEKIPTQTMD